MPAFLMPAEQSGPSPQSDILPAIEREMGEGKVSYLVHTLGFMSFDVPDLDGAVADYTEVMGLQVVERTTERAILTSNARPPSSGVSVRLRWRPKTGF